MRLGLAFVLLLLTIRPAPGQLAAGNPRRDSLEVVLRRQLRPDTIRLKTLNELVWEHRDSDPARSFALAAEALQLGQRLNNKPGQAKTYILRGILHAVSGDFDQSIADFEACRRLRQQLGDWQGVAGAINNIGEAYAGKGDYEKSVAKYVEALRLEERYGTEERIAADLANLGSVYYQMGRYRAALRYHLRYLTLPGRTKYAPNDVNAYYTAGLDLAALGRLDSARLFQRRALAAARSVQDTRGEAQALSQLGTLLARQGEPVAAAAYHRQALARQRQLGDQPGEAASLTDLGELTLRAGPPAAALPALEAALRIAQKIKAKPLLRRVQAALARAYAGQDDFRRAFAAQQQAGRWQDSLLTEASSRQITEMQTRYETERKEAQNQLLRGREQLQAAQLATQKQVIARRNAQLLALLAVATLLAGLSYFYYARRQLRQQVVFGQERQTLLQQRVSAVLEAEEAERRRIGADLHDGVGQLLTVAKLNLQALGEQLLLTSEDQRSLFRNALDMVDESFGEVRQISHNLMPNALLKRGLTQALRDFLQKISPTGQLRVQIEVIGLDETHLAPTVENVLFRVIQELVQNIIKHAQATEVVLQLIRVDDELTVLVQDNGRGFDPAALAGDGAGIGLRNVTARMAYLGGRADFDSRPGRGATVTLEVPLAGLPA